MKARDAIGCKTAQEHCLEIACKWFGDSTPYIAETCLIRGHRGFAHSGEFYISLQQRVRNRH